GNVQDTVGVNVKGDLDLGHTTGCGWNARELELAKHVVVLGHGSLAFVHLDQHTRLVVRGGGEGLGLHGGDGGVSLDERGHDSTSSFDTQREWGNIEQQQILHGLGLVTVENGSLHSGTIGDGLIGVDRLVQLLAVEKVLEQFLDFGNTGGTTDQDNLVNLVLVKLGITQRLLHR